MSARTAGAPIAFAALCCVLGLAAGFGIQSLGRRIDDPDGVRGVVSALVVLAVGMVLAALAAHVLTVWLSLVAATVLGCGYGMAMIAGLLEVQRIAGAYGSTGSRIWGSRCRPYSPRFQRPSTPSPTPTCSSSGSVRHFCAWRW
jgi:hypothetical protein